MNSFGKEYPLLRKDSIWINLRINYGYLCIYGKFQSAKFISKIWNDLKIFYRPAGGSGRELYCPPYSKDFTESSPKNGVHNMVHMVAERDTDSVAPTPTPQHPHHSQHYHLSLHEIRALQVF